ncbi:MAG: SDR family NAD(P)-dependent oxidoreductase [Candidimonas sp.]|nr:MAG: SDR family NAD(P)-dependent oxidoreductase [Candidimonas sp.]TAM22441.1 MAG: SDR family NAD(P)-dependent oxidoreductase [Candidimonas sp.]
MCGGELERDGIHTVFYGGDAANEMVVKHAVAQSVARYGRMDVLINNAGIGVKPAFLVVNMPLRA